MASSVTVEDSLRKKIKRIAAELDTTQGDVISRAVKLLEDNMHQKEPQSSTARKIMKDAVRGSKDKKRQKIREKLSKHGIGIDEIKIVSWGDIDED